MALWSCGDNTDSKVNDDLDISRFDKTLMSVKSKAELSDFLTKNPWYARDLYRAFPDDTAFVSHLYYIVSHPGTQEFYKEVDSTFGDLSGLKKEFAGAFDKIRETYPTFKNPRIYTTFTGLENDMFVSDSVIIISLEAFIGPKASYRPDQPAYLLRRFEAPYIVPAVLRLLSDQFIKSSGQTTMLDDMVYFGKSYEFTKNMLPEVADSLIIGIPDSSLTSAWYAQDIIWAYFIDKKLLFEQNQRVKEKYLGERPVVSEIGPACPGRIGQWLGWRIIDQFRTENPDLSLKEILEMPDAQEILRKSKYRGQIDKD